MDRVIGNTTSGRITSGTTVGYDAHGAPPPLSQILRQNAPTIAIGVAAVTSLAVFSELAFPAKDASQKAHALGGERDVSHDHAPHRIDVGRAYWEGIGQDPKILPPDVLGLKSPELHSKLFGAGVVVGLGAIAVGVAATLRRPR